MSFKFKIMLQFNKNNQEIDLIKVVFAFLIHAAKIDEKYTDEDLLKTLFLNFHNLIKKMSQKKMLRILIKKAEEYENNSNHILRIHKGS